MPPKKTKRCKNSQGAGFMSKVIPSSENQTNRSPNKQATFMMI